MSGRMMEHDKIELLFRNVNPLVGNPTWGNSHIVQVGKEWAEVSGVEQEKDDEKKCVRLSADLKCTI